MAKTVAQYIIDRLSREVKHAFCLPGGASIFLIDALNNSPIQPVFNLHEQACSIAADAYGQYTNKLGLCIVTAGPGSLNALTGVAAAYIDSTPMIILSGQANSFHLTYDKLRSRGIQEVRTTDIVKPIVKRVYQILDPLQTPQVIEDAIFHAKSERPGPVWIDIPLDIQNKIVPDDTFFYYTLPLSTPLIDLAYLIDKLLSAKQPVVMVGNGVRLAHAEKYLYELLDGLKIPVLTTWRAMDLFEENHPLYCGRPGMIGQRGANWTLQNCDVLLSLGCRLDLPSVAFDYKNFAPKAMKFIVDIDQAELGKMCGTDESWLGIRDNVGNFLETIYNKIEKPITKLHWLTTCKAGHDNPIETIPPAEGVLSLYQFIDKLTPHLEDKVVAVGSSGSISEVFCQSFKVPKGCRVIQSNGLGSMGFGLSAAIGAHYASGKPVVCLDGDGSFAMNMQELALVKEKNLPITIFIINNGGYVSIKNTQDNICEGRRLGSDRASDLTLLDYEKVASSYDIPYYSSGWYLTREDFFKSLSQIPMKYGPRIIQVFTDPSHRTQCRTTTTKQEDGTLKASGLEILT